MASLLLRDCCPSSTSCLAAFECGFRSNVVVHCIWGERWGHWSGEGGKDGVVIGEGEVREVRSAEVRLVLEAPGRVERGTTAGTGVEGDQWLESVLSWRAPTALHWTLGKTPLLLPLLLLAAIRYAREPAL